MTIGNNLTSIGGSAFSGCTSLTSITIPDSVTIIGYRAFLRCTSLASIYVSPGNPNYTSIDGVLFNKALTTLIKCPEKKTGSYVIPDSVISIGGSAFWGCTSLTSVTIGNNVTSIGENAFYGCTSLTSITIPDSVTRIGNYAFSGCTSLTSITIPDSVTNIGRGGFYKCTSLTSVTIGNGVRSIDMHTFYDCSSLVSITLGNNVTSIYTISIDSPFTDWSAFYGCTSLTSVTTGGIVTDLRNTFPYCTSLTILDGVTNIPENAFYEWYSLTSVTIGNSVTIIGNYTFYNCYSLISLTIPDSVTIIGNYTFYNCYSLISLTIPDSVIIIGNYAFHGCTSLTSVTIGNGVTSIGDSAFSIYGLIDDYLDYIFSHTLPSFNISLSSFYVSPDNPSYASVDGVLFNKALTILIQCPGAMIGSYVIPDSVTSIESYAFYFCTSLTSITIPDSVTIIGNSAFCGCLSLASITIGKGVTSIESYAFYGCTSLASIEFLGFVSPNYVGESWIGFNPSSIRGHAYEISNFPVPGSTFYGLTMGEYIPPKEPQDNGPGSDIDPIIVVLIAGSIVVISVVTLMSIYIRRKKR